MLPLPLRDHAQKLLPLKTSPDKLLKPRLAQGVTLVVSRIARFPPESEHGVGI